VVIDQGDQWEVHGREGGLSSITQGSKTLFFSRDVGHPRFKQVAPEGTTLCFDACGVHSDLFSSAVSQWNDYLMVGGAMVRVRFNNVSAGAVSTRYFHADHLGSISVITDDASRVVERLS